MSHLKTIAILLVFSLSSSFSFAQKKQLDHTVYDDWKSLTNISIDNNGRFAVAIINPQEGDSKLFIQDLKKNKNFEYNRISGYSLSPDGSYTVALLKAPFADTRQAKIDKKKPEEMPKDSLLIIDNETFTFNILPNVKSYKTSQELGNYVAYKTTLQKDTTTVPKDTTTVPIDTLKNKLGTLSRSPLTTVDFPTADGPARTTTCLAAGSSFTYQASGSKPKCSSRARF